MPKLTILISLFTVAVSALIAVAMETNDFDKSRVHSCTGPCYEQWRSETGGVVAVAQATAQARAEASPAELGEKSYASCIACHGANGEGGIGPALAGQSEDMIQSKLLAYKRGETVGPQSMMMWGQAAALSEEDIANLAAFAATL